MPAWVKSPQPADDPGLETKWEHVLEWRRWRFPKGRGEGVSERSQHRSRAAHAAIALL